MERLEFGLWTVKKAWFNVPRDAQPFCHVDTVTRLGLPPPSPRLHYIIGRLRFFDTVPSILDLVSGF